MTFCNNTNDIEWTLYEKAKTSPYPGQLKVLRTFQECQATTITTKAYITKLPLRSASFALKACKEAFPDSETWGLHHIRRFAKPNDLPAHVLSSKTLGRDSFRLWLKTEINDDNSESDKGSLIKADNVCECIWYFVGPVNSIQLEGLYAIFSDDKFLPKPKNIPEIHIIDVPVTSPESKEEATLWSGRYWPTIYKRMNPLGPHYSIVSHAEAEIGHRTETWMSLARLVAQESFQEKLGENFGCLIVERDGIGKGKLVSLAADLRHAAMRAIGMIARKRKLLVHVGVAEMPLEQRQHMRHTEDDQYGHFFSEIPFTPLEKYAYPAYFPSSDSYLCTGFEIYLTHEPCIMCSMAILHSRFGRCVFGKRMPMSGGLFAEPALSEDEMHQHQNGNTGLSYGLFWRPELNSKFLCWQWCGEHENNMEKRIVQV